MNIIGVIVTNTFKWIKLQLKFMKTTTIDLDTTSVKCIKNVIMIDVLQTTYMMSNL